MLGLVYVFPYPSFSLSFYSIVDRPYYYRIEPKEISGKDSFPCSRTSNKPVARSLGSPVHSFIVYLPSFPLCSA